MRSCPHLNKRNELLLVSSSFLINGGEGVREGVQSRQVLRRKKGCDELSGHNDLSVFLEAKRTVIERTETECPGKCVWRSSPKPPNHISNETSDDEWSEGQSGCPVMPGMYMEGIPGMNCVCVSVWYSIQVNNKSNLTAWE